MVILAIFAARSIMRPEKFKTVYQLRKEANVQNLLAIRSAQAVYKNVHKVYADDIDKLVDFVNNGTVMIEKNVGNFPDTMSEAQAFKLGLIHKEIVEVPAELQEFPIHPLLQQGEKISDPDRLPLQQNLHHSGLPHRCEP